VCRLAEHQARGFLHELRLLGRQERPVHIAFAPTGLRCDMASWLAQTSRAARSSQVRHTKVCGFRELQVAHDATLGASAVRRASLVQPLCAVAASLPLAGCGEAPGRLRAAAPAETTSPIPAPRLRGRPAVSQRVPNDPPLPKREDGPGLRISSSVTRTLGSTCTTRFPSRELVVSGTRPDQLATTSLAGASMSSSASRQTEWIRPTTARGVDDRANLARLEVGRLRSDESSHGRARRG